MISDCSNTKPALESEAIKGARNLLIDYLRVQAGDLLLLVRETDETLYSNTVGDVIASTARHLGAELIELAEPLIQDASEFPGSVSRAMQSAQHTVFLSRLGDYVRFIALPGSGSKTTCYIYDLAQLASPYASISHTLLASLRDRLETELMAADHWHITCPLGTDISGQFSWASLAGGDDDELLVDLFPVSTFKPIPCNTANGVVALSRWLMPGGSTKMEDQNLAFDGTVLCKVRDGSIVQFEGDVSASVEVSTHYDRVADTLGINRNRVHSWHLGINPQTYFAKPAEADMDTWCAMSFASPRYLHFHTCGDEPPGEIAWSLFNCSVSIDDQRYWENGEFIWLQREDNKALIQQYPDCEPLLQPSLSIGI